MGNTRKRQAVEEFQMITNNNYILSDEDNQEDQFDSMSLYKAFGCLEVGS